MKRNIFFIIFIALSFIIVSGEISQAITVTASPNPATVNQNVTVNITASFTAIAAPPLCTIRVDFGDGTPAVNAGTCTFLTCSLVTNHTYTTPGTYTITTRSSENCANSPPTPPDPATTSVTIQCPSLNITSPSTLSSSTVGQAYSYQVQSSGGQLPVTYSLVSGSLPPGLSLSSTGLISGTPTTAGSYSFTLRATDSCPTGAQSVQRIFSIQVQASPVTLSVAPVPSSFSIPRGQSSTASVNYQFTGTSTLNTTLNSSGGSFMVGADTIETNPAPLTVTIQNGSGRVSEVINVPVRVIERTLQRGTNRFIYVRTFTGPNITLTATVNLNITTEAGADFDIKRIELYFENRRAETTVERNYPDLKAFADIRFVGSGLLQGYWEVDGRILSYVNQHLTFGRSVTLQTPEIPPLPTFDTGTHIVRFVITAPVTEIPLPSILYFVTPAEFKAKPVSIRLIAPKNESVIEYLPVKFEWEKINKTALFLIQFFDDLNSNPIFSAYAKDAFYSLPELVLKSIFSPGQKYYWKVKGFDAENNIIGESTVWNFSFKKLDAYVPGQIITALTETVFSEDIQSEIMNKYKLKVIDAFSLKSVNLSVALFETTEKDIFRVIDELKKDSRILIVQPNFILRTMGEPLRKMQYASDILKLDKIHDVYRGRGIKVAVLDTGVDTGHNDLKDRVIGTKNFVRGENYASEIHGTAIAGVIAASINGFGIEGVAPDAGIIATRACKQVSKEHPEGECFTDSLSKAIDEAISQKVNIVNMSFGTAHYDNLVAKLIDRGVEHGILFVAPAGNLKNEKELRFPASYPSVISTGGFDERLNPYPNPDITKKTSVCAPAVNIITTVPDNKHNFLSGTSMSSAYISGILALALEKDKGINKQKLPVYKGDICKWEEELLKIEVCGK